MKNVLRLFMILCITLAGTAAVFAQDILTKGSITGQVTDASQGAISGATVKVTGGSAERTTTTNDEGFYTFDNLNPGNYTVRVEMANFKSGEVSNVTVFVGKSVTTNVTLQAGNISETLPLLRAPTWIKPARPLDLTSTTICLKISRCSWRLRPVLPGPGNYGQPWRRSRQSLDRRRFCAG